MKENALVVVAEPADTPSPVNLSIADVDRVATLVAASLRSPAAKPSPRGVMAHLEHPSGGGRSLCGAAPARLRPCPACLARRAALLLVHVQSHKRRGRALCGLDLAGDAKRSVAEVVAAPRPLPGSPGWEPSPMYVSADRARQLLADDGDGLPVCPGCEINLMRAQAKLGEGGER